MLFEILNFYLEENGALLIHILNLFILLTLIVLFVFARHTRKKWSKVDEYFRTITNTVNSVRYGDLSKKIGTLDLPNTDKLAESLNRMIETLKDREQMVVEHQTNLRTQNKFLQAVINSLSDGLIIIDETFNIIRVTPHIEDWFGLEEKEILGLSINEFVKSSNNKAFEDLSDDEIYIKNSQDLNFIASTMLLNLDDEKNVYVIIIKNITDQKELETLKEDFVATLTHDLKVPIIAETNMLELFLSESFGKISEKQTLALKNMQASNKELLDLVQIMLDTYKMRDGNIKLYKENIMLKSFLNEIIEEMTPIAQKAQNNINLILSRDIMICADRMQFKRVIKNLIQNAISYGKSNSPIEITIGEIPKFIVITVKDYGMGISEVDINKIFNKYYSTAKKFRKIGTGLGLYLALQIVRAHGGELSVESIQGEYTEFCIKLPVIINGNVYYGQ